MNYECRRKDLTFSSLGYITNVFCHNCLLARLGEITWLKPPADLPNKRHICSGMYICTVVNERVWRRRFVLLLFVTRVPAQGNEPDGLSIREGRGTWKAFSCLHDGGLAFVVSAHVLTGSIIKKGITPGWKRVLFELH